MRWRLGILSATLLACLSLYPQFSLIQSRGTDYEGAAFVNDNDESVYLAYLQSLIDGHPRKNNIYSGGTIETPETFLSIQALPAYAISIPAGWLGLSAEAVFPLLSFLFSFAAALSLYWFFYKITDDEAVSATAVLFVLIIGTTVAGYGTTKYFLGLGPSSASFPFLRRYTPGLTFPFLFILMGTVYKAYTSHSVRRRTWIVASLSFIVLQYSYFYLWTSAFGWMAIVFLLTFLFPSLRASGIFQRFWLPMGLTCALASLPYVWLLNNRSPSTDSFQALESTRAFVIARPSIWVGVLAIICLVVVKRSRTTQLGAAETILVAACALLPMLVFEQHVITGYSLQPFHYNLYTAPYFVLIATSLLFWLKIRNSEKKFGSISGIVLIIVLSLWGLVESHYVMNYRWAANIQRDRFLPVNRRLRQLGMSGKVEPGSEITFNSNLFQADNQPSTAPQGVLWSEHMPWASVIDEHEARRRYFAHLYFMGRDAASFTEAIEKCPATAECKAIFGWRVIPTLAIGDHSPGKHEIDEVSRQYLEFLNEISRLGVPTPAVSYAVIDNEVNGFDPANLDRWYQRDAGEDIGSYSIFRLTPKKEIKSN